MESEIGSEAPWELAGGWSSVVCGNSVSHSVLIVFMHASHVPLSSRSLGCGKGK